MLAGLLLGLFSMCPLLVSVGYDPAWRGRFHRDRPKGTVVSRAGACDASLWIAVTVARLWFAYAAQHEFPVQLGHFLAANQLNPTASTKASNHLRVHRHGPVPQRPAGRPEPAGPPPEPGARGRGRRPGRGPGGHGRDPGGSASPDPRGSAGPGPALAERPARPPPAVRRRPAGPAAGPPGRPTWTGAWTGAACWRLDWPVPGPDRPAPLGDPPRLRPGPGSGLLMIRPSIMELMNVAGHPAPAGQDEAPGRAWRALMRRLAAPGSEVPVSIGIGVSGLVPHRGIRAVISLAGLGASLWYITAATPLGLTGPALAALVSVVIAGLGWLLWLIADVTGPGARRWLRSGWRWPPRAACWPPARRRG